MEALLQYLRHLLSFYLSLASVVSKFLFPNIARFPFFVPVFEMILSLYFRFFCDLEQCMIDLDDQTTMHFWVPVNRKSKKPNLLMIHGYGGNCKWQFAYQAGPLAQSFNLYIPELLFFGKSHTNRTEIFQAECVYKGLRRLGVKRFSLYAISYGGYVGYRMAEMHSEMVEKVVIVSSGVGCSEDQKGEQLKKMGRGAVDLLLPDKPDGFRLLVDLSFRNFGPWPLFLDYQNKHNLIRNRFRIRMECVVQGIIETQHVEALEILLQGLCGVHRERLRIHELCLKSVPNLGLVSSEVRLICDIEQPEPTWTVRHIGGAMRGAGAEQISVLVRTMAESKVSKNALRLFYALGYKLDHELLRVGFAFHFYRGAQITATVSSINKMLKLHATDEAVPVTPGIQLVEVTAPASSENYTEVVAAVTSFCEYLAPLLHLSKPGVSTGVVPTAAAAAASLMSDVGGTTL